MKQHGGKRANSGRKKGTGKGRTVKSSSITLKPEQWAKLDAIRGKLNRSKWIAGKIDEMDSESSPPESQP